MEEVIAYGTISVWIDDITPCLKDNLTGEFIDTEVIRIRRKSFLSKFTKANGWYVDWASLAGSETKIFALVVKGSVDIQGLVAVRIEEDNKAVYVQWMCTAPWNNPELTETPKYSGVGGHLFAIAGQESVKAGFEGDIYGFATNEKVLNHYIDKLSAVYIGILHPFQFVVYSDAMSNIISTYTYDDTEDEI
ncbi:MAG: hypothetical protein II652_06985 [Bacteroidales bacterium]|nr:hypothetical protein [Bacteroidales bacterium]MBQ4184671.1 hypothetical protein [Bacteroidales bacterium]